jgi:hypothetical protein
VVSSTPRPHFTSGRDPVPVVQEAGWAPGLVCVDGKSYTHQDLILDHPARSQLLYRLSYPAHQIHMYVLIIRIYHDAQSSECQIHMYVSVLPFACHVFCLAHPPPFDQANNI